jgi:RNA polymerase sigma-70 factor, ECF subfamily
MVRSMGYTLATHSDDDLAFLERLQLHDPAAGEEFFHRYYRFCFRVAIKILKNEDEAADEAQAALVRALTHLSNFKAKAQFRSWLTRIVINGCFMRLRRDQRWHTVEIDECGMHPRLHTSASNSPEGLYELEQVRALVRREIARVPKPFRQVLVLRYLEDKSLLEVASMTGITLKAAKSRLHRARLEIRSRLERNGVAASWQRVQ